MGGLVARYFLEVLGGAEICRSLITLGTPYRGSLAALRWLAEGFMMRTGMGRRLTGLARSLPSLHQLTPAYNCVEGPDGLRPFAGHGIIGPNPALVSDATAFHREIAEAVAARGPAAGYDTFPIIGFGQPTPTTVRAGDAGWEWKDRIDGEDEGGDGRVPFLSSAPPELQRITPVERAHLEKHGALVNHQGVREGISFALTQVRKFHRGPEEDLALRVASPEVVMAGEPWQVEVSSMDDRLAVRARLADAFANEPVRTVTLANRGGGRYTHDFAGLPAGAYSLAVSTYGLSQPVTSHVLVWEDDSE
jgi:hypothetical protein